MHSAGHAAVPVCAGAVRCFGPAVAAVGRAVAVCYRLDAVVAGRALAACYLPVAAAGRVLAACSAPGVAIAGHAPAAVACGPVAVVEHAAGQAWIVRACCCSEWPFFVSCCSCCADAGAAIPRRQDRVAVRTTPINFIGVASVTCAIAGFPSLRWPGYRLLRRIRQAQLFGSAVVPWRYRS